MSCNAGAAIEWYPNKDSLLSATVYYKQFNGGFQPVVFDEEFVIDGQAVTVPVTQTRNSPDKSRLYGLELTPARLFRFLPTPLARKSVVYGETVSGRVDLGVRPIL